MDKEPCLERGVAQRLPSNFYTINEKKLRKKVHGKRFHLADFLISIEVVLAKLGRGNSPNFFCRNLYLTEKCTQSKISYLSFIDKKVSQWRASWNISLDVLIYSLNSSSSVIEVENAVPNVEFVIPQGHSPGRISGLHVLHKLYELITMFTNFSRKVLWHVDIASFQHTSFAKDLFFVAIIDQTELKK